MLRRTLLGLALLSGLAACGAEPIMATSEEVQKAAYSPNEPPYMTLITVISNENGSGGHTGLIINASQRVVWDPAGTWYHPWSPEQNDVHFGITDYLAEHYVDYHARETFHVVTQKVPVSRQVAEMALAATRAYGAVPKAYCAKSTSEILKTLPGFENMPDTFRPKVIMEAFDSIPGVQRVVVYDDSPDDNKDILEQSPGVEVAQALR